MPQGPITITILHNIFLTKEERYKLANGEDVETVGISVPVWFCQGKTTEPAIEVFCKYKLTNAQVQTPITTFEEGYLVNIPQASEKAMNIDNALESPQIGVEAPLPTAKDLKDIKDGGCAYMQFKQYTKVRKNKKNYNLLHFVEIKEIEVLIETLT